MTEVATAQDMEQLGAKLASHCPPNCMLFLQGELGSGKTTLVRGFLHAKGWQQTVKSPSYSLIEPYELEHNTIYHLDLYRVAKPEELEELGIRDYFAQDCICIVEWPENGYQLLPSADLIVNIAYCAAGRLLKFNAKTDLGSAIIDQINQ